MKIRHTRDGRVWIDNQVVSLADVQSVIAGYALPSGYTHYNYSTAGELTNAGFDNNGNQKVLPDSFINILNSVAENSSAIIAARDAVIVAAEAEAEAAEAARIAALPYDKKREIEYIKEGVTTDKLVVALWEMVVEGRTSEEVGAAALQAKREAIKTLIPKG